MGRLLDETHLPQENRRAVLPENLRRNYRRVKKLAKSHRIVGKNCPTTRLSGEA